MRIRLENILYDIFKDSLNNRHRNLYFDVKNNRVAIFSVLINLLNQFIDILLKLKLHREFKNFIQIINYATNNLEKIIHIRQNFDKFISLCRLYGKIYGVYGIYEYNKEDDKDGEKRSLNFIFSVILNPQKLTRQKGIKMSINEFQNTYPKLIKRFDSETGENAFLNNKLTNQFKQWLHYQLKNNKRGGDKR